MTKTITDILPLDTDPNYRVIFVNGESILTIPTSTVERLELTVDQLWTVELAAEVISLEDMRDATSMALQLISKKAWGVQELATRLVKRGIEQSTATLATEQLEADGWLDDFAYACARIRDWTRAEPASRYWLRRKLEERELASEVALEAIEEELGNRSEQDAATELAVLRLSKVHSEDESTIRRKVISALSRRGFPVDVGAEALRRAQAENA